MIKGIDQVATEWVGELEHVRNNSKKVEQLVLERAAKVKADITALYLLGSAALAEAKRGDEVNAQAGERTRQTGRGSRRDEHPGMPENGCKREKNPRLVVIVETEDADHLLAVREALKALATTGVTKGKIANAKASCWRNNEGGRHRLHPTPSRWSRGAASASASAWRLRRPRRCCGR